MKSKEELEAYLIRVRGSYESLYGVPPDEMYLDLMLEERFKQDLRDFFLGPSGHFSKLHLEPVDILLLRDRHTKVTPPTEIILPDILPEQLVEEPKRRGRPRKQLSV